MTLSGDAAFVVTFEALRVGAEHMPDVSRVESLAAHIGALSEQAASDWRVVRVRDVGGRRGQARTTSRTSLTFSSSIALAA